MSATVFEAFQRSARLHADCAWLCVPPRASRDYAQDGLELTYAEGLALTEAVQMRYRAASYGVGHRVALMLDNRPEHFIHLWALNGLGVSVVPINADLHDRELAFVLQHAEIDLALVLEKHASRLNAVAAAARPDMQVSILQNFPDRLPDAARDPVSQTPVRSSEAALIYTSGTTGTPKGCLLDNEFMFAVGNWYAQIGGRLALTHSRERIIVPLPVFHVNAGINTPTAMLLTANCMILPDRFRPDGWWQDVVSTRATAMHYLGAMPPLLLKQARCAEELRHGLKFGLGAGIDPQIHSVFEERFNVPMVEVWGMTETGRFLADTFEPRQIQTRAFGRPTGRFLAKVIDERGLTAPHGSPGELVVRSSGDNPRFGFFRGYLKEQAITEEAWRDGWFHTGDVATQSADGMLYFVERRKNIIRRSGENISAAEVENALVDCPGVQQVAVIAVADELRDEEVMACVVLESGTLDSRATALAVVSHARRQLAYHKVPGWVVFVNALPRTSTQKIQKQQIFERDQDPRAHASAYDLRSSKKRNDGQVLSDVTVQS